MSLKEEIKKKMEEEERQAKKAATPTTEGKPDVVGQVPKPACITVLILLIVSGIILGQHRYALTKRHYDVKVGKLEKQVETLKAAAQNDSLLIAQSAFATGELGKDVASAKAMSIQTRGIALETQKALEPISEQLDGIPGQFTTVKAGMDSLATRQAALEDSVSQHHQEFIVYRTSNDEQVQTFIRRTDAFGNQISGLGQDIQSQKGWNKVAAIPGVVSLSMIIAHWLGHSGR